MIKDMNNFVREYLSSTPIVTIPSFAPPVTVNNQPVLGILKLIIIIIK